MIGPMVWVQSFVLTDCHLVATFQWINRGRFLKDTWHHTVIILWILHCMTKSTRGIKPVLADKDNCLSARPLPKMDRWNWSNV